MIIKKMVKADMFKIRSLTKWCKKNLHLKREKNNIKILPTYLKLVFTVHFLNSYQNNLGSPRDESSSNHNFIINVFGSRLHSI